MARWQRIRFMLAGTHVRRRRCGTGGGGPLLRPAALPTTDYGVVPYQTVVHLEEVLEMGAIVLPIYALLRELEGITRTLRIELSL